jgi:VanZ family protein
MVSTLHGIEGPNVTGLKLFKPSLLRIRLLAPSMALIVAATMIPTGLRYPSLSHLQDLFNTADFVNNLILYMPLGIALSDSSLIRAFLFGLLLSTCAEVLQLGYVDRIPSFLDIASNTAGALIGYLGARFFLGRASRPRSLRLYRAIGVAAIPLSILGTLTLIHEPPKADFSDWDPAFHLAVGNELTGDRPWSGTISKLAIYPSAMSPSQLNELAQQSPAPALSEAPIVGPMGAAALTGRSGHPLLSQQEEIRFFDTVVSRGQLTLAVWMRPNNLEQGGPARIVTYSQNPSSRNFTLGQIGNTLTFRLRTPASGINGVNPALYTGPVLSVNNTSFVAAVYDGRVSRLYVDGKRVAQTDLAARRPRLPRRILPWLPNSLPIREIELCGAEILLSGLLAIGIFSWGGVPERRWIRYFIGASAGVVIGAIVWVFAVSNPGLGFRILMECVGAGLVISASVETLEAGDESSSSSNGKSPRRVALQK